MREETRPIASPRQAEAVQLVAPFRKPYVEPRLACYGEVARLTLNVFSF